MAADQFGLIIVCSIRIAYKGDYRHCRNSFSIENQLKRNKVGNGGIGHKQQVVLRFGVRWMDDKSFKVGLNFDSSLHDQIRQLIYRYIFPTRHSVYHRIHSSQSSVY